MSDSLTDGSVTGTGNKAWRWITENKIKLIQTGYLLTYVAIVVLAPAWFAGWTCKFQDRLFHISFCPVSADPLEQRLASVLFALNILGSAWGFLNYFALEDVPSIWLRLLMPPFFAVLFIFAANETTVQQGIGLLFVQLLFFLVADLVIVKRRLAHHAADTAADRESLKRGVRTLVLSTGPALIAVVALLRVEKGLFTSDFLSTCVRRTSAHPLTEIARMGADSSASLLTGQLTCEHVQRLQGNAFLVGSLTALMVVANGSFVLIWWTPRSLSLRLQEQRYKRVWYATAVLTVVTTMALVWVMW